MTRLRRDRAGFMALGLLLCLAQGSLVAADKSENKTESPPEKKQAIEHTEQTIEGWKVMVDKRLLAGGEQSPERTALKLLAGKLHEISILVPKESLAKLREVVIYIDLDHSLKNMQYHPSRGWLKANGHDTAMTRAVHIPNSKYFVEQVGKNLQPHAVLHELAHAYHDQVLDFDNPRVKKVFDEVVKGKSLEAVLRAGGRKHRHYALTNEKEFFAEMTECFFGTNDFYPFVRAELAESEPETYKLMKEIWGVK